MSIDIGAEVLEEKHIPNPIARKLLEKIIKEIEAKEGSVPPLLLKTVEYLRMFSKMEPEKAEELEEELKKFNLKPETIVMIINICPKTLDELRTLLTVEERTIDTEEATKILEVIQKYCS